MLISRYFIGEHKIVNHGLEVYPISDQPIWDIYLGFDRQMFGPQNFNYINQPMLGLWWLEVICSGNMANRFLSSSNGSFSIDMWKITRGHFKRKIPMDMLVKSPWITKKSEIWQVLKQIYCRWRPEESCTFKAIRLGLDGHGLRSLESPCSFPQKRIELPWTLSIYYSQKGYDRTVIDHSSNILLSFYSSCVLVVAFQRSETPGQWMK